MKWAVSAAAICSAVMPRSLEAIALEIPKPCPNVAKSDPWRRKNMKKQDAIIWCQNGCFTRCVTRWNSWPRDWCNCFELFCTKSWKLEHGFRPKRWLSKPSGEISNCERNLFLQLFKFIIMNFCFKSRSWILVSLKCWLNIELGHLSTFCCSWCWHKGLGNHIYAILVVLRLLHLWWLRLWLCLLWQWWWQKWWQLWLQ